MMLPQTAIGRVDRQAGFYAFDNGETEQIVRRRESDRQRAGAADQQLRRRNVGLARAIGLQQRQMNGADIARRAQLAGLGLIGETDRGNERRMVLGLACRQEAERRRQRLP